MAPSLLLSASFKHFGSNFFSSILSARQEAQYSTTTAPLVGQPPPPPQLPTIIMADLASLRATLNEDLYNPRCCRLIGLLIPRNPTITIQTDAATGGLGG